MLLNAHWFKVACVLLAVGTFTTLHAAKVEEDHCRTLDGTWTGTWRSKVGSYTCQWNASAKAKNEDGHVHLDINLSNPNSRKYCTPTETFMLVGRCLNNQMAFNMDLRQESYVTGLISANNINLSGKDVEVNLSRKATKKVGDADIYTYVYANVD